MAAARQEDYHALLLVRAIKSMNIAFGPGSEARGSGSLIFVR